MNNLKSQVAGTPHSSLSIVSEPLDIRNWFSSYTYQSPEIDTNEVFGDAVKVDEEEKGLYVEDSEKEEEDLTHQGFRCRIARSVGRKCAEETREKIHPPAVEVPVYPDSLSLPSEPPDIREWFPSYEYESPTLDTADFYVSLSSGYDFRDIQEVDQGKEENLKKFPVKDHNEPSFQKEKISNSCATSASSIAIENGKHQSTGQEQHDLEGSNLSSNQNLSPEGAVLKSDNVIPDIFDDCPRSNSEHLSTILQDGQQTSRTDCLISPAKAEMKFMAVGNESGWIVTNNKAREIDHKRFDKEHGQHNCTGNGYTLLKKKPSPTKNDENILDHFEPSEYKHDGKASPTSSTVNGKHEVVTREALKERTNFQQSNVMEVAGKWKCPQRTKPDTGPPLKQLRLERWVRRI